jgi:pyruvate dehydrogenase E2 component (dihydrolipoamide acetyltransferase)
VRRRIAEAMEHSARTIPHVCGFHEFDAEGLVRLRAALKARAGESDLRLTYLPFIVRAVALALKGHPYLNASLDDEAQVIRLKKVYNIGIATAAADGLTVPVIRHADRLGLLQIAREADRLVSAARDRTLTPAEVQEGTFTITNVGASRGWLNTSLIRHPEVAILGAGRIEDRAVDRDGQLAVRPILPLALTFDHRVIDGEQALAFMLALRSLLESPEGLLLAEPGV